MIMIFAFLDPKRQQTHSVRKIRRLQRPLRPFEKGHVGRFERISCGQGATRGNRRQETREIQEGSFAER